MEERTRVAVDAGITKAGTTAADLKLRMAEHIITQYNYGATEVRDILAETKVGGRRKSALLKKLSGVFSVED
jgi:hypothetical protein